MQYKLPDQRSQRSQLIFIFFLCIAIGIVTIALSGNLTFKNEAAEVVTQEVAKDNLFKAPKTPEFAPGEVIVKFREPLGLENVKMKDGTMLAEKADKESINFNSLDEKTIPTPLRKINHFERIDRIQKIFQGSLPPQKELAKIQRANLNNKNEINEKELLKNDLSNIYRISFKENYDILKSIKNIKGIFEVEIVEPNYIFTTSETIKNSSSQNYALQFNANPMQGQFSGVLLGDIGGSDILGSDLTIEMWIKPHNTFDQQTILNRRIPNSGLSIYSIKILNTDSKENLSELVFDTAPIIGLRLSSYDKGRAIVTDDKTWTHVAIVKLGSKYSMYLNGALVSEKQGGELLKNTSDELVLGIDYFFGENNAPSYQGAIEDLRISNYARDIKENWLQGIYYQTLSTDTFTTSLYHFDYDLKDSTSRSDGTPLGELTFSESILPILSNPSGDKFGNAIKFENSVNFVQQSYGSLSNDSAPNKAPISIEAWVKYYGISASSPLFYQRGAYRRSDNAIILSFLTSLIFSNDHISFGQNDINSNRGGYANYNYSFVPNTWYHIGATSDGVNMRLFLNGRNVATTPIGVHENRYFIDTRDYAINTYFGSESGSQIMIDELRVSNSVVDIESNWNNEIYLSPLSKEPNTIKLFHFDEPNGSKIVFDTTPNNWGNISGNVQFAKSDIPTDLSPTPTSSPIPTSPPSQIVNDPYFLDPNPPAQERTISDTNPYPWNPDYDYQWGLKMLKVPIAWTITKGSNDVRVAVIDTGVDYTHEDLVGIPIIKGYDFVNNDIDPIDDHGHGTHVAGIIAAKSNNDIGIAGVNQNVTIIAEKVLSKDGSGMLSSIVAAIYDAVDKHNADILNFSLGGGGNSEILNSALDYADGRGVVIVAAAGNSSSDVKYFHPANYKKAITVAAVTETEGLAFYSNYGEGVDISAPGGNVPYNILSLRAKDPNVPNSYLNIGDPIGKAYTRASGTSMAAPFISGISALIIDNYTDIHGTKPSPSQVSNIIINGSTDKGPPGYDIYFGYGIVNAYKSIEKMDDRAPAIGEILYPINLSTVGLRPLQIFGSAIGEPFSSYKIEWKWDQESVDHWKFDAIALENNGTLPIANNALGTIDLSKIISNADHHLLNIRLSVSAHNEIKTSITTINLNSNIRNGFPIFLPPGLQSNSTPVISDVDNNGDDEIVYVVGKNIDIYNNLGVHLSSITRSTDPFLDPMLLSLPSIGESIATNQGKEITAIHTKVTIEDNKYVLETYIGLWNKEGNMMPNWPQQVKRDQYFYDDLFPVMGDIDGDNLDEIVFADTGKYYDDDMKLYVWKGDGNYLFPPITIPSQPNVSRTSRPILADINGDGKKDIILTYDTTKPSDNPYFYETILVYSSDGKKLDSWPADGLRIRNFDFGKFTAGDLNKDGESEIIYSQTFTQTLEGQTYNYTGFLHAVDSFGRELAGWPIAFEDFIDNILIADIADNGDKLEVLVYNNRFDVYTDKSGWLIYDYDGKRLPSLNYQGALNLFARTPEISLGDINSDNKIEVIGHNQEEYGNPAIDTLQILSYDPISQITSSMTGFPIRYPGYQVAAIGDLDKDTKTEVIYGLNVINTDAIFRSSQWPQYLHDAQHSGAYSSMSIITPSPTHTPTSTPSPTSTPTSTLTPTRTPTPVPAAWTPYFWNGVGTAPTCFTVCSKIGKVAVASCKTDPACGGKTNQCWQMPNGTRSCGGVSPNCFKSVVQTGTFPNQCCCAGVK